MSRALLMPWSCREEWEEVYSWLYSSDPALVKRGVGRVSAWKARGRVPMMVEMTANLCECRVCDRETEKSAFQVLSLQYSMAITRFVNGIGDIAKETLNLKTNLLTCVNVYGIPSWVVTLRHSGTHEKLPSLGALRAGAEFSLSWLRANYWRPQRLTIGEQLGGAKTMAATPLELEEEREERTEKEPETGEGHVWRLTNGLCRSRDQLAAILVHADDRELSSYMKQEQLLQFPPNVKYTVTVPDVNELDSLSILCVSEGDMAVWRTHFLKAAKSSCSVKQRLVSALISAVNAEDCSASLRHFLCGWLNLMWKSDWPMETGDCSTSSGAQVIKVLDGGDEGLFPGGLDWMELFLVAKQHPGYYLYAILNEITRHFKSPLSESTVGNMMHLSALATLSSRMGQLDPQTSPRAHSRHHHGSIRGTLSEELEKLWALWNEKLKETGETGNLCGGGALKGNESPKGNESEGEEGETRWKVMKDTSTWLMCPIGVCPEQRPSANMLDLPLLSAISDGDGHHDGCSVVRKDLSPLQGSSVMSAERMALTPVCHTVHHYDANMSIAVSNARIVVGKETSAEQLSCEPFTLNNQQIKKLQHHIRIL